MDTVRARLRAETHDLHVRVERACPFGTAPDRAAYVRHLERRYGFQVEVEAALARWAGWDAIGFPRPVDGVALLVADLRHLGCEAIAALPRCPERPPLSTFERALGCAYVLEGARIGGQVVAGEVARTLGLVDGGVTFLSSGADGAAVGARFRAAVDALERHAATRRADRTDEIVAGARDTFATLARWLERGAGHA